MSKVIGIDLGTTNSVVAVMEGATPSLSPALKEAAPLLRWWPLPKRERGWWVRSQSVRE